MSWFSANDVGKRLGSRDSPFSTYPDRQSLRRSAAGAVYEGEASS